MEESIETKVETRFPKENYSKSKSSLEKKIISSIEPNSKEKLRELISSCEEEEQPPGPSRKSYYFDWQLAIELYREVENELRKRGEKPPIESNKLNESVKKEIEKRKR